MKKLRRLSLLLVLELGCMGAAMPEDVGSRVANITVDYYVLKTTGVEKIDSDTEVIPSHPYSKHKVDITERSGTHFTAAFIASNNSQVYEANASVKDDIVVDVTEGGVTVNLYYTETGSSSIAFIDQSDRLVVAKTYTDGASLGDGDITEAVNKFEANLPSGYGYGNITDERGNPISAGLTIDTDRLFTVNSSKIAEYASFDVLVQRDSGVESSRVGFDEIATVTSTDENFSYWAIGEKIVSYENEYSFSVYSDTVIKEVCGEVVEKKPIVTLHRDNIADTGMNNIYEVKYEIPAGFDLVETGMIFGGTTLETATSKVVARRITSNNEYSVRSAAIGDHRAYLIYRKDGKLNVIYDDGYGVEQLVFNHDSELTSELVIADLEDCITSSHSNIEVAKVTKAYGEGDGFGIKLGSNKASGYIVINSDSEITFDKVVVNAKKYGSDTGAITVTGTTEEITPTANYSQLSFDLTTPTASNITVGTTAKRAYVNYIELYYSNRAKEFSLTGLTLGDLSKVFNDIELPAEYDGYPVTWTSSNPSVISETGVVSCPESGSVEVELTATCNGLNKSFTATVYSSKEEGTRLLNQLEVASVVEDGTSSISLASTVEGYSIKWSSSNPKVVATKTASASIVHGETDVDVTVTASVVVGKVEVTKDFVVTVKAVVVNNNKIELNATSMTGAPTSASTGAYSVSISYTFKDENKTVKMSLNNGYYFGSKAIFLNKSEGFIYNTDAICDVGYEIDYITLSYASTGSKYAKVFVSTGLEAISSKQSGTGITALPGNTSEKINASGSGHRYFNISVVNSNACQISSINVFLRDVA